MAEESGVGNLQTLKLSARATSKFKILQPTLLADLEKHQPEKYLKSGKSLVKQADLGTLTEGDMVRIAFINNEDLWITVDSADLKPDDNNPNEEAGIVYGKTCQQAMKLHGLQKGQRVCFDVKCVCEIRYHSDSEDESDSD